MSCSTCSDAQADPLNHREHRDSCISCAARALAQIYGDYPPELARGPMFKLWPTTKDYSEGRRLYWSWVRLISEAKEKT